MNPIKKTYYDPLEKKRKNIDDLLFQLEEKFFLAVHPLNLHLPSMKCFNT